MSFAKDIQRFAAKAGESADQTIQAVTIALFNGVIRDTPVDEGRARGDWQTTVGNPASGQNGRDDTTPTGRDGGPAQAEVIANTPEKAGGVTYLSNNMPYIVQLEEGSSGQAPAGMARRNMDRIQRNLAREARKNKV
ncbi:hypothetical protein [Pseudomonas sp.]|uniref:hypothetical protein n=1 Tax=Pseudomonas sp. TaxID=306 RepID=UPI0019D9463C|nr:hypothetical protein [Pseudomonas sp.]MBF0675589.1 HK97 gp10 family phage protein [Pseudomonas sp.]